MYVITFVFFRRCIMVKVLVFENVHLEIQRKLGHVLIMENYELNILTMRSRMKYHLPFYSKNTNNAVCIKTRNNKGFF